FVPHTTRHRRTDRPCRCDVDSEAAVRRNALSASADHRARGAHWRLLRPTVMVAAPTYGSRQRGLPTHDSSYDGSDDAVPGRGNSRCDSDAAQSLSAFVDSTVVWGGGRRS